MQPRERAVRRGPGPLLLALALAACGERASSPRPSVTELDLLLPAAGASQLQASAELRASCNLVRRDRRVTIRWKHAAEGDFRAGPVAAEVQRYRASSTPIVADFAPADSLLVALLSDDDRVVVERWVLQLPEVVLLDGGRHAFSFLPQREVWRVLEIERAERGLVCGLVANRGRAGRSFVRFAADPDLRELDWSGDSPRPLALALSARDQPLLRDARYTTLSGGAHRERGFVYELTAGADAALPPLLLVDSDRDGRIDASGLADSAPIQALGPLDSGGFEEQGGLAVE